MGFTTTILQWFRENGRALPWRETRDPYAIWLSEIILQQTRIEQGLPYWERFIQRWPTVEALAEASEDEVLREWQGLGYYSRARNLHTAAKQVVAGGGFPTTIKGLRALKGIGDYTAAAIGSFAFGLPAAVVDGNVYRVLARHYGISTPINTTEGKKEFQALAQELLPSNNSQLSPFNFQLPPSAAYNQALMDFGAIHCTPAKPLCLQCPLQDSCVAFREGRTAASCRRHLARALRTPVDRRSAVRHCYRHTRYRHTGRVWRNFVAPRGQARPHPPRALCRLLALATCRAPNAPRRLLLAP